MCVAALARVLIAAAAVAPAAELGAFLGELTWPEAEVRLRQAAAVVLPFGPGAKEHGPHLPMNADEKSGQGPRQANGPGRARLSARNLFT